jgi:hypothetical protein
MLVAIPLDGSTELVIGVSGEVYQTIDKNYLPNDVLYGDNVYGRPVFDFELWCWRVAGISNITGLTYSGITAEDNWINVEGTREHLDKIVELAANQLLFLTSTKTIAVSSSYDGVALIKFWEIGYIGNNVKYGEYALKFRWSDTDNCVQRSCIMQVSVGG